MPTYYTNDLTQVPLLVLLRLTWRNPLAFVYVALRKLLRMPFTADWGIMRADSLCELEWVQIPPEARREMETRVADLVRQGLLLGFCGKGAYIGNQASYAAVLVDRNGSMYAIVTWLWVRAGTLERADTTTGCHSALTDGRRLHTFAGGNSSLRLFRYMLHGFPPEHVVETMPTDTSTSAILARHQERLAGLSPVIAMSVPMVKAEVLKASQQIIDRAVQMGHFVPLSQEDVDRLRRVGE